MRHIFYGSDGKIIGKLMSVKLWIHKNVKFLTIHMGLTQNSMIPYFSACSYNWWYVVLQQYQSLLFIKACSFWIQHCGLMELTRRNSVSRNQNIYLKRNPDDDLEIIEKLNSWIFFIVLIGQYQSRVLLVVSRATFHKRLALLSTLVKVFLFNGRVLTLIIVHFFVENLCIST